MTREYLYIRMTFTPPAGGADHSDKDNDVKAAVMFANDKIGLMLAARLSPVLSSVAGQAVTAMRARCQEPMTRKQIREERYL